MSSPFMVAVAGGSGAGKTTFVRSLQQHLGRHDPLVIRIDDYYRDLSHLPAAERARCNFDDPDSIERDLLHEQISHLREGLSVQRPVYDFATHTRSPQREPQQPSPIIIVDGIFSLCFPELCQLFDLKLFLDVDGDIRVVRRFARDMAERGRSFSSCSEQYQQTVKAMHDRHIEPTKRNADFVIPWFHYNERTVAFTAGIVLNEIAHKSSDISNCR